MSVWATAVSILTRYNLFVIGGWDKFWSFTIHFEVLVPLLLWPTYHITISIRNAECSVCRTITCLLKKLIFHHEVCCNERAKICSTWPGYCRHKQLHWDLLLIQQSFIREESKLEVSIMEGKVCVCMLCPLYKDEQGRLVVTPDTKQAYPDIPSAP